MPPRTRAIAPGLEIDLELGQLDVLGVAEALEDQAARDLPKRVSRPRFALATKPARIHQPLNAPNHQAIGDSTSASNR